MENHTETERAIAVMRKSMVRTDSDSDDPDNTITCEIEFSEHRAERDGEHQARFRRMLGTENEFQSGIDGRRIRMTEIAGRRRAVEVLDNMEQERKNGSQGNDDIKGQTDRGENKMDTNQPGPSGVSAKSNVSQGTAVHSSSTICKFSVEDILNSRDDEEQAEAITPIIVAFCAAEKTLTGSIPSEFVELMDKHQSAYVEWKAEQKRLRDKFLSCNPDEINVEQIEIKSLSKMMTILRSIQQREKNLAKREDSFAEVEATSDFRHLKSYADALNKRATELADYDRDLEQHSDDLWERQARLNEEEYDMRNKEREIERREIALRNNEPNINLSINVNVEAVLFNIPNNG